MTKITDPITYQRRRLVVATLGLGGLATFGYLRYDHRPTESIDAARATGASASPADNKRAQSQQRRITTKHAATHYNNAYEFGWNKTDPARYAAGFHLRPWTITFDGLVENPGRSTLISSWAYPLASWKNASTISVALRLGQW